MPTLPLKYCKTIKEALKYVDYYEIKKNHVRVESEAYFSEFCYEIYHYDVHIANIYSEYKTIKVYGGAYSMSDCNIINSFCMLYGISERVKKKGKKLYVVA